MTQTPRGPEFGDAPEFDDSSAAATVEPTAAPQVPEFGDAPEFDLPAATPRTASAPDGTVPHFADAPPEGADGPGLAGQGGTPGFVEPQSREPGDGAAAFVPPAAAPAPRPARTESSATGRVRAIVGGITILAILAIGLAVFLPREQSEQQPQAGMQTTQSPTPSPQPVPDRQYQQQATGRQQQTDQWAQQAHQEFLQRSAQAKAQGHNQGAAQGQAPTGNSGGDQTATNSDGGTGYSTCPDCGGEGTKPCPMKHLPNPDANGLYHMLNPYFASEPRYYSGSDPLLPEDADMGVCPYCGGKGRVPCDKCGGHGQVPDAPTNAVPGGQSGAGAVDDAVIDSVARQLIGSGGQ